MKFKKTALDGAYVVNLEPFLDNRGMFVRLFCKDELKAIGHNKEIVQINHSMTKEKGSVRGMHYQLSPHAEIKIVRCMRGSVFDVIIDLRKGSPTFLKWHGEVISAENMKMMYIPEGFAHGFQTLEDDSELIYLHTEYYDKESERSINSTDPAVKIKWPLEIKGMSEKDKSVPLLGKGFRGV
jgi:dTDP-4-dehydrorhamnose 3,5-epimerase